MRIGQRQFVEQLNIWILFIKVNNLDLLALWNTPSVIEKTNRSRWQICLHLYNSLSFQYHFVIHFNNSRNYKTTAVTIGCFFTDQSSYTGWDEWRTNNVKAKTCLFTGQVDVQHMTFTYVSYNRDSRDNNMCGKRILAITNLKKKTTKNVPYNTSWTVLTV